MSSRAVARWCGCGCPQTLIFLLLAPFAPLLLSPLLYWVPWRPTPTNPFAMVLGFGDVLLSLGGTVVDVETLTRSCASASF